MELEFAGIRDSRHLDSILQTHEPPRIHLLDRFPGIHADIN